MTRPKDIIPTQYEVLKLLNGTEVVGNIIHCKNQKSRLTKENLRILQKPKEAPIRILI